MNQPDPGSELEHITDGLMEAVSDPRPRYPEDDTAWEYLVVHPDGSLSRHHGGRWGIIRYLRDQDDIRGDGELGNEMLEDLPGVEAVWVGPFDRDRFPDNPVANRMIQVFDLGGSPGYCRGDVVFTPGFYLSDSPGRDSILAGHRLELVVKIHAELRDALAGGREPRKHLWPSEMITASRSIAPDTAWQEFQWLRATKDPDVKITDLIREREIVLRAGRDPDQ